MRNRNFITRTASAIALGTAACAGAHAAPQGGAVAEAYRKMQESPADAELAYAYAKAALKARDLAGAIAGLERVLLIDPTRDNIRYDLGQLYAKAGNRARAEPLLILASQSARIPADVRTSTQITLDALGELPSSSVGTPRARTRFYGQVYAGAAFETNPRQAPTEILFGGDTTTILSVDPTSAPQEDFAFESSFSATLEHRLGGTQHSAFLSGNGFLSRHDKTPQNDISVASAEAGLTFRFDGGVLLQPYFRATHVLLADDPFSMGIGGGVSASMRLAKDWRISGEFEGLSENYRTTKIAPNGDELDGRRFTLSGGLHHDLSDRARVGLTGLIGVKQADVAFEAFKRGGGGVYATYLADWAGEKHPITLTARANYEHAHYDAPEGRVDPTRKRKDSRYSGALAADFALTSNFSLSASVDYAKRQSNLVNFDFDNFGARVGATIRF